MSGGWACWCPGVGVFLGSAHFWELLSSFPVEPEFRDFGAVALLRVGSGLGDDRHSGCLCPSPQLLLIFITFFVLFTTRYLTFFKGVSPCPTPPDYCCADEAFVTSSFGVLKTLKDRELLDFRNEILSIIAPVMTVTATVIMSKIKTVMTV